jgi:hypothetical protein
MVLLFAGRQACALWQGGNFGKRLKTYSLSVEKSANLKASP